MTSLDHANLITLLRLARHHAELSALLAAERGDAIGAADHLDEVRVLTLGIDHHTPLAEPATPQIEGLTDGLVHIAATPGDDAITEG